MCVYMLGGTDAGPHTCWTYCPPLIYTLLPYRLKKKILIFSKFLVLLTVYDCLIKKMKKSI